MNLNSDVTILGATGMLGSACVKEFPNALKPSRNEIDAEKNEQELNGWVINCIGAIPQKISDREKMWKINSEFPKSIQNAKVIQIATDCIYSGKDGNYSETSNPDPVDEYGKSKLAGEDAKSLKIRCSIIGPDKSAASLFEWVRQQPQNAVINGFTNHIWNGVTTKVFANMCQGIIENEFYQNKVFHFVPADRVSKFELIKLIANRIGRNDLEILPTDNEKSIDRSLSTNYPQINQQLWEFAGYSRPPTIAQMIQDMDI
jgi:dTDP-4-dehydrorhamnose reductase